MATRKKPIAKTAAKPKARSAPAKRTAVRSTERNTPRNTPRKKAPAQAVVTPALVTAVASPLPPDVMGELAELRQQILALASRQQQPAIVMMPPMQPTAPVAMTGSDEWFARHHYAHEREELATKVKQQDATISELREQAAQASEAQANAIKALQSKLAQTQSACDAEAKAKQTALAERDTQTKLATERQASITQLQKQVADLKAVLESETRNRQATEQKLAELTKNHNQLQQQLKTEQQLRAESTEEGELLLTQLHQVQEELERYFLEAQALRKDKEQLDQRVQRLLKRLPDVAEWDDLKVEADKNSLNISLKQVLTEKRRLPQLQLMVAHNKKQPTLQLQTAEGDPPALLHGNPAHALNPFAASSPEAAETISQLAPSDLQFLQTICAAISSALPSNLPARAKWAGDLTALAQQFRALPATWRYDTVVLKHEQVNPDYEHLWFRFENATYGSRHWPSFEFRLSAANVRKGKFSQYPKLNRPGNRGGSLL